MREIGRPPLRAAAPLAARAGLAPAREAHTQGDAPRPACSKPERKRESRGRGQLQELPRIPCMACTGRCSKWHHGWPGQLNPCRRYCMCSIYCICLGVQILLPAWQCRALAPSAPQRAWGSFLIVQGTMRNCDTSLVTLQPSSANASQKRIGIVGEGRVKKRSRKRRSANYVSRKQIYLRACGAGPTQIAWLPSKAHCRFSDYSTECLCPRAAEGAVQARQQPPPATAVHARLVAVAGAAVVACPAPHRGG